MRCDVVVDCGDNSAAVLSPIWLVDYTALRVALEQSLLRGRDPKKERTWAILQLNKAVVLVERDGFVVHGVDE